MLSALLRVNCCKSPEVRLLPATAAAAPARSGGVTTAGWDSSGVGTPRGLSPPMRSPLDADAQCGDPDSAWLQFSDRWGVSVTPDALVSALFRFADCPLADTVTVFPSGVALSPGMRRCAGGGRVRGGGASGSGAPQVMTRMVLDPGQSTWGCGPEAVAAAACATWVGGIALRPHRAPAGAPLLPMGGPALQLS